MIRVTLFILLAAVCEYSVAVNKDEPKQTHEFVLGNLEFVLLHEFSHVIIGDNQVPVLGPVETAADYLAVSLAIRGDAGSASKGFLTHALLDSAAAFSQAWQFKQSRASSIPYWDQHGLSIQRYYNILCLIYGSDPDTHPGLLDELPQARAIGCAAEQGLAEQSLDWILREYGLDIDGANEPVESSVEYLPVRSAQQLKRLSRIQTTQLVERTTKAITGMFRLAGPVAVKLASCKRPEAAWDPETRVLLVCYEMIDAFYRVQAGHTR